ncbi:NAD(P)-dependent oxidoreductase [Pseudonocardia sp. NPDC049635]|uniref:NAD-dependent epimerase/dehydratase family protein n=1 Tax=Pseudonocardia sp. NPDC049635 TaxID=3155506 RepID=UPI0033E8F258
MSLLLTGAAGNMGTLLRPRLARSGRTLRLLDTAPLAPGPGEQVHTGSVTDPAVVAAAVDGADAVVHLAGISGEAGWDEIVEVNLAGTRTVLDAAVAAGVRTVVLASSNHAVGFRTRADGVPLPAGIEQAPDTYYGWSKAAVEGLGRLYHERYGLTVVSLRIGTCFERPHNARALATWLSPDDAARLVEAAVDPGTRGHHLVWGVSANTRRWWSLEEGAAIGYHPRDDAEVFAAGILAEGPEPDPAAPEQHRVGGGFCELPLGVRMR